MLLPRSVLAAVLVLSLLFVGPRRMISTVSQAVHILWNKLTYSVLDLEGNAERTLRQARERAAKLVKEQETARSLAAMGRVEAHQAREEWDRCRAETDQNLELARAILAGIQTEESREASERNTGDAAPAPNPAKAPATVILAMGGHARTVSFDEAHRLLEIARDRVEQGRKRSEILARRVDWTETEARKWSEHSLQLEKELEENTHAIEMAQLYVRDDLARDRWTSSAGGVDHDQNDQALKEEIERALAVEAARRGLDTTSSTTGTESFYEELIRQQKQQGARTRFEAELDAAR